MFTVLLRLPAFLLFVLLLGAASAQDQVLVPFGATWKYLDNGTDQGTTWRGTGFDDSGWASGPAELGYGDGDEATVVSYGPNANNKYVTTYFRKTLSIADLNAFSGFLLRVKKDDGAIVIVNGNEVMRANMNQGTNSYTSGAYTAIGGTEEALLFELLLTKNTFTTGSNTIAVEVHQDGVTSADLSFDLQLTGLDAVPALFDPPMLGAMSPTSVVVKWTTDIPTNSRVRFGTAVGALNNTVNDAALVTDHEITLTGLAPGTNYYYSVGTSLNVLAGDDANHTFKTFPASGTSSPVRIWAIGDAGTTYQSQLDVRNAYSTFVGASRADVWLMLGDNSYWQGRSFEYHESIFKVYQQQLRSTPLFAAPGNHDYYSGANGNSNNGPFYNTFVNPTQGQSGGVASGKENYYSFDFGRVHFICLDSYGVTRATSGAMYTWLVNDLAYADANSDWIIAYWHHPPYTKGTHDSDQPAGDEMTDMRSNFLPLLEQHGVDLVLCGHSHVYERSYLTDGHYGLSSTYNAAAMRLDGTSGLLNGTGPYRKRGNPTPHKGTVYGVCGVSGKSGTGALNHPVMYMGTSANYGSLVIDINNADLRMRFLNSSGIVVDDVSIRKSITISVKAFLQGCYDPVASRMRDDLRNAGLIPLTQPFTGQFTFVGEGGTETISPSVLAVTGNDAIVDWVFLELRNAATPSVVQRTRAALIQRDGDVVDIDGISPVQFDMPNGTYHVALRHRNHLSVMTGTPVALTQRPANVDFRSAATTTYGSQAEADINGVKALWSGDVVKDGTVRYTGASNDRDPILVRIGGSLPNNTVQGYFPEDVDLDGTTRYTGANNDRDRILVNVGSTAPNNTRSEQLP